MENEKLFELMEKMYVEIQGMKSGIKELKEGQPNLDSNIKELKIGVKDLKEGQTRIENKLDDIEANNVNKHLEMGAQLS